MIQGLCGCDVFEMSSAQQFGSACEESVLRLGLHLFFEVLEEVVNQGDALDGGASSEIDENRVGEDFRQGVVFQRFVRLPVFQLVAELAVDDAIVQFGEEVALLHAFVQKLQRFRLFRARVSVNFLHDFGIFPDFFKETWFDGLQESESDFERFQENLQDVVVLFKSFAEHAFHLVSMLLHAGKNQFFFVGEDLVERTLRHGQRVCDVVHGDVFHALAVKRLCGDVDDVFFDFVAIDFAVMMWTHDVLEEKVPLRCGSRG